MAILALVLAATVERCDTGTTYDIRACWSRRDSAAQAALDSIHARVVAEMRQLGVDPQPLAAVQGTWRIARDKTCEFEYEQYLPGTIAPQLGTECNFRMTQARTQRLGILLAALHLHGAAPSPAPISAAGGRELERLYADLAKERLVELEASWVGEPFWT